jgi:hypothetical protein
MRSHATLLSSFSPDSELHNSSGRDCEELFFFGAIDAIVGIMLTVGHGTRLVHALHVPVFASTLRMSNQHRASVQYKSV